VSEISSEIAWDPTFNHRDLTVVIVRFSNIFSPKALMWPKYDALRQSHMTASSLLAANFERDRSGMEEEREVEELREPIRHAPFTPPDATRQICYSEIVVNVLAPDL